jgi:hypothetical protein
MKITIVFLRLLNISLNVCVCNYTQLFRLKETVTRKNKNSKIQELQINACSKIKLILTKNRNFLLSKNISSASTVHKFKKPNKKSVLMEKFINNLNSLNKNLNTEAYNKLEQIYYDTCSNNQFSDNIKIVNEEIRAKILEIKPSKKTIFLETLSTMVGMANISIKLQILCGIFGSDTQFENAMDNPSTDLNENLKTAINALNYVQVSVDLIDPITKIRNTIKEKYC